MEGKTVWDLQATEVLPGAMCLAAILLHFAYN